MTVRCIRLSHTLSLISLSHLSLKHLDNKTSNALRHAAPRPSLQDYKQYLVNNLHCRHDAVTSM